jgi:hypothetical protein
VNSGDTRHDENRGLEEPTGAQVEGVAQDETSAEEEGLHDDESGSKDRPRRRVRGALRKFFRPGQGSPRWRRALPWVTVVVVVLGVATGGTWAWTWGASPSFCGTTCHTMPPQYVSYQLADHSRVTCAECHIGRGNIATQIVRKAPHVQLVFRTIFGIYEYPIYATSMRPAREACETCHTPEKFSADSLVVKQHYVPDETNSSYSVSLVMKTGGGSQREGLGYGIHWHIENKVQFVSTDELDQNIPYVRVTNADGTVDEYVDFESDFDKSKINESDLKTMDCITCHNRVSHPFQNPVVSVESSMSRGAISATIPYIRREAVKALSTKYYDRAHAFAGIRDDLDTFYKTNYPDFYATGSDKVKAAITEVQRIYSVTVFADQEIDWTTHPDNLGHMDSPGCFRCHDGKHLDAAKQAVRLECNVCHSIPVVTTSNALVTNIEVPHGPEPASHLNANWISLHNTAIDKTCATCHTTADAGGTSNTSFCSNSTCHGTAFTYAGFDAPALRRALRGQVTPPGILTPEPSTSGQPTWNSFFGPLLVTRCSSCHGDVPAGGLNLTSYASAMKGGNDGPAIIPGNSAGSLLVQVQNSAHQANLSAQELEAVKKWIDAGAPQK